MGPRPGTRAPGPGGPGAGAWRPGAGARGRGPGAGAGGPGPGPKLEAVTKQYGCLILISEALHLLMSELVAEELGWMPRGVRSEGRL